MARSRHGGGHEKEAARSHGGTATCRGFAPAKDRVPLRTPDQRSSRTPRPGTPQGDQRPSRTPGPPALAVAPPRQVITRRGVVFPVPARREITSYDHGTFSLAHTHLPVG